jgi:hypothetical protein
VAVGTDIPRIEIHHGKIPQKARNKNNIGIAARKTTSDGDAMG